MSKDKKDKSTLGSEKLKPIVQINNLKCNGKPYNKGNELKGANEKLLADLLKKGTIKYQ